jgi:hypothetical protein
MFPLKKQEKNRKEKETQEKEEEKNQQTSIMVRWLLLEKNVGHVTLVGKIRYRNAYRLSCVAQTQLSCTVIRHISNLLYG